VIDRPRAVTFQEDNMEIILTRDVDNLGLTGQVVKVANGYARNLLIPGRFALKATPANLKMLEKQRAEFAERAKKDKERAAGMAARLAGVVLTIARKAGEKGKLYGAVTTIDIAEALAEKGIDVDRRKIRLAEPIKSLGEHDVFIKLHAEVAPGIKVLVVAADA
jgi:large subunit ribosomal protein L9